MERDTEQQSTESVPFAAKLGMFEARVALWFMRRWASLTGLLRRLNEDV